MVENDSPPSYLIFNKCFSEGESKEVLKVFTRDIKEQMVKQHSSNDMARQHAGRSKYSQDNEGRVWKLQRSYYSHAVFVGKHRLN